MKKLMALVVVFLLLAPLLFAEQGMLVFKTNPKDVDVYINGIYKGNAKDLLVLDIDEGKYTIKISKGGNSKVKKYIVPSGGIVKVDLTLETKNKIASSGTFSKTNKYGYLSVASNPQGMNVFINDRFAGISPINRLKIDSGNYTLTLKENKKDNFIYSDFSQPLTIKPFQLPKVNIQMEQGESTLFLVGDNNVELFINDIFISEIRGEDRQLKVSAGVGKKIILVDMNQKLLFETTKNLYHGKVTEIFYDLDKDASQFIYSLPINSPPIDLRKSSKTKDSINLRWDHLEVAENYILERNGTVINSTIKTNSYSDTTLVPGIYTYRIRAKNRGGESPWSTTLLVEVGSPDPPSGLVISDILNGAISLKWSKVKRAEKYILERNGAVVSSEIKYPNYLDKNLKLGVYNYRLRAVNQGGKGPWSNILQVKHKVKIPKGFVFIKPGTFLMGKNPEASNYKVTISKGFYLLDHEVTVGEYYYFDSSVKNSKCFGYYCPVIGMSWESVQNYITWLNNQDGRYLYRLPTEAEWEYAARAGATTKYFCGNDYSCLDGYVSASSLHPIKQKKANPWGLYDIYGNATELVQDWYGPYPIGSVVDPTGPSLESIRNYNAKQKKPNKYSLAASPFIPIAHISRGNWPRDYREILRNGNDFSRLNVGFRLVRFRN